MVNKMNIKKEASEELKKELNVNAPKRVEPIIKKLDAWRRGKKF